MKILTNENILHENGKLYFKRLLRYEDIVTHYITCKDVKLDNKNIIKPKQSHTDNVEIVKENMNLENVDGLITNERQKALVLRYADCIPLLFFDPTKKVIANVHSGWRGTYQKIGMKALEKLIKEFECNPKDIICCIGPSIRKCHFEVGEDVKEMFEEEFGFKSNENYIDTVLLNKQLLIEKGIDERNIVDANICTVCNKDILCSYRGNNDIDRMNALIELR